MFKTGKKKAFGIGLALAILLSGVTYATTALADDRTSAFAAQNRDTTTPTEWRAEVLEMLRDHMGLSRQQAEEFANEMVSDRQVLDKDFDFQDILGWCTPYSCSTFIVEGNACPVARDVLGIRGRDMIGN